MSAPEQLAVPNEGSRASGVVATSKGSPLRWPLPRTLRGRMVAIFLGVALVPLVLLAWWLTGATARSGEALLRARLAASLDEASYRIGVVWTQRRSELLDLADAQQLRAAALSADTVAPESARAWLAAHTDVTRLDLTRPGGALLWSLWDDAEQGSVARPTGRNSPAIRGTVPVHEGPFGARTGDLIAHMDPQPLVGAASASVAGMVLAAFEPQTGALLSALPFDPMLLREGRFGLGQEEWLTARRVLREPAVELVTAAALTPYVAPFQFAARRGLLVLLAVSTLALLSVLVLTRKQTQSLEKLAAAADAVRRGEWDGRVDQPATDEVGRVAHAFNSMTDSLRRTVAELADRRALAAVGEFAASLAHEVRNPLTSILVDLQMVEERLPDGDITARDIQARAVAEIQRLDATLAGALQTARSGRMNPSLIDLRDALEAAANTSRSAFRTGAAELALIRGETPVLASGDHDALVQLILNLLLNGAQAAGAGGRVTARCRTGPNASVITIDDDGPGIDEADLEHIFEPLYSTREGGTGLGLAIAKRLAHAHGGDVVIENLATGGARATLTLPVPRADASMPPVLQDPSIS